MDHAQNRIELGQLIRTERKRQQPTQEKLAELSGVGVRFVRELEPGKEGCHIWLAFAVMQRLVCPRDRPWE
ncbi:transcriptional regulator [Labrenzia sp. 011]|nr:transcriptional regulator [Labrenzia sp. 011]PVB59801.1 transcriptional regulator [Labrenzia sp. 011]